MKATSKKDVDIFAEIKRETPLAILVSDGIQDVWLPKSQVEYDAPNLYNQTEITLPEWLAKNKGLI